MISADEKTSIQARQRCHPTLAPASARDMRVEHEYDRGGALAYLAAWDVHRARVFGRCEPTTGIEPFGRLVEQVMGTEPYASARRVFWVVDNGSSHRGQRAVDRMRQRWPNARLVQLPVHASWLNQVEIYFSVVQRKVLTPNDFADLAEVESRLAAFERRYEQTADALRVEVHPQRPHQAARTPRRQARPQGRRLTPPGIRDRNYGPQHLAFFRLISSSPIGQGATQVAQRPGSSTAQWARSR